MPKLTKRVIDALKPREREFVEWDTEVRGFGARIRPSGKITYILKYRVGGGRGGTIRKPNIGVHGAITVGQARSIAQQWLADVAKGGDPSAGRSAARDAATLAAICDRYLVEHAEVEKRPRSVVEDRRLIEKRIKPAFGRKSIMAVTRTDVSRLKSALRTTPYEANRTLALLSKVFNLAEEWGERPEGTNPCRRVKKFPEAGRERFLSTEELARLGAVLAAAERSGTEPPAAIAALRLLIFTGCRRSEILTLQWPHVDFEGRRLRLPDSKTGAKVIHLPAPALEVLSSLPRAADNPHVIAGRKAGSHLVNLTKVWHRIRANAGIADVRIHDLRHSFASAGTAAGLSLPMIGKMLGHTQASTTQRYMHLAADPVKEAVEIVATGIASAMRGETVEVVAIGKGRR